MKHLQKVQATEEQPPKSDLWLNKKEGTLKEFTEGEWKDVGGAGGGVIEKFIEEKNITKFYYNYNFANEYLQNTVKQYVKEIYPTAQIGPVDAWFELGVGGSEIFRDKKTGPNLNSDVYLIAGIRTLDVGMEFPQDNFWTYHITDQDVINSLFAPIEISKEEFLEKLKSQIFD